MRRDHNEILQIEPELVFHAPLTSDVTDIIGGIVGTRNTNYATFDSYASTRGIRIATSKYQSPIYWTLTTELKTLLMNATYIKFELTGYPLRFYTTIPNVNNGTWFQFMNKHTNYAISDSGTLAVGFTGNGDNYSFTSVDVSNTVCKIYEKINNIWYASSHNLTRGTLVTEQLGGAPNFDFLYLIGPTRFYYAYGYFTGYAKDFKIWVQ